MVAKLPSSYVPKADGYLNVGVGGMAQTLKQRGDDIWRHWENFTRQLTRAVLVRDVPLEPKGYSYYLRKDVNTVRIDNAFIAGDAIGLATRDKCEGIGPAIRSGLMAAEAIYGTAYSVDSIKRYSIDQRWINRTLEYLMLG